MPRTTRACSKRCSSSVRALAGVRPEYLAAAYETIREEFEGVEYYIERAVGLDASARGLLRQRFLVGSSRGGGTA
jgi:hypothetical protein